MPEGPPGQLGRVRWRCASAWAMSTTTTTRRPPVQHRDKPRMLFGCQRSMCTEHGLGLDNAPDVLRGTGVEYSNAIDFHWARVPPSAQIRAQTSLDDCDAGSSQRGGQGFESPQLHRYHRRSKTLSRSGMRAFLMHGGEVQQQSTAVVLFAVLCVPLLTRALRVGPRGGAGASG